MTKEPYMNWQYAIDAIQLYMDEHPDTVDVPFESIVISDTGSNIFSIKVLYNKQYDQGELEYSRNTRKSHE